MESSLWVKISLTMEVFELHKRFVFFIFNDLFLYSPHLQDFCFKQAYQTWLTHNKETTLPGLKYTNEQLFYISFAQVQSKLLVRLFCMLVLLEVHFRSTAAMLVFQQKNVTTIH